MQQMTPIFYLKAVIQILKQKGFISFLWPRLYMHVHRELIESEKVLQNILFSCQFCMVFYVLKIGVFLPNFNCVFVGVFSHSWLRRKRTKKIIPNFLLPDSCCKWPFSCGNNGKIHPTRHCKTLIYLQIHPTFELLFFNLAQ